MMKNTPVVKNSQQNNTLLSVENNGLINIGIEQCIGSFNVPFCI